MQLTTRGRMVITLEKEFEEVVRCAISGTIPANAEQSPDAGACSSEWVGYDWGRSPVCLTPPRAMSFHVIEIQAR
jgi:hypothetical protein